MSRLAISTLSADCYMCLVLRCVFGSSLDRIDYHRIDYDKIDFEKIDLCLDTIM